MSLMAPITSMKVESSVGSLKVLELASVFENVPVGTVYIPTVSLHKLPQSVSGWAHTNLRGPCQ